MKISVKGCVECPFRAFKQRGFYGEVDVCAAANDRDLMLTPRKDPPGYAPDWCPANGEGVTVIRTKPSALSKIVTAYVPPRAVNRDSLETVDESGDADPWGALFSSYGDRDIPF